MLIFPWRDALVGAAKREQRRLGVGPGDELKSGWQAVGRESTGHRQRWQASSPKRRSSKTATPKGLARFSPLNTNPNAGR